MKIFNISFEFIRGGITIIVGENNIEFFQELGQWGSYCRKNTSLLDLFSPDTSLDLHLDYPSKLISRNIKNIFYHSNPAYQKKEVEGNITLSYKLFYFDLTTSTSFLSKKGKEEFEVEKVKTRSYSFIRHEEAGLITYRGFNKDICHSLTKMGSGYLKCKTLESLVEDINEGYIVKKSRVIPISRRPCFPVEIHSTILLIDEPEVFLHPSLLTDLANLIKEAIEKDITIILTTHSPSFLLHFVDSLITENNKTSLLVTQKDENELNLKCPLYFQDLIKGTTEKKIKKDKNILFVEGMSDYILFNNVLREELRREMNNIEIIPIFDDDRSLDEKGNPEEETKNGKHEKFWRKYGVGKVNNKKGEILHSNNQIIDVSGIINNSTKNEARQIAKKKVAESLKKNSLKFADLNFNLWSDGTN
ncbi:AAA domain-containing protein [Glomus cerebriforme]|uniref:AAA domain-containing protein n=1 Tax=Glomus cerebriforme TaxID=658196 RepID=A0A397S4M7_9GLOM|nr:AAA domain-containing protein [Glomus cerebriforme]